MEPKKNLTSEKQSDVPLFQGLGDEEILVKGSRLPVVRLTNSEDPKMVTATDAMLYT